MSESRPLAIDLYCGLGGWTEGLLAEGFEVIGFDNEQHVYGEARYPAQLVIQDVLTLHGAQFKDAALIVASPPCQEFSYMAMPWSIAKQKAREYRDGTRDVADLTRLFDACFRIQREACEAARRHIPLVVENVCGAQKWVGRARWHYGSFYLWGDVPALMPIVLRRQVKCGHLNWDQFGQPGYKGDQLQDKAIKVATMGSGWYPPDHPKHVPGLAFNGHADRNLREGLNIAHNTTSGHGQNPDGRKTSDHVNQRDGHSHTRHLTNQREHYGVKVAGNKLSENGLAIPVARQIDKSLKPEGFRLNADDRRQHLSYSRKAASAHIAKIPLPLARHIARAWHPEIAQ